ncbi:MAG: heme ABC transporter ATP-binding protein [Gammaproteobacteria bacterium]|nr:MAG: heme ABC transporter ATP-binding protein [Gammaproteobacteria bacterium]
MEDAIPPGGLAGPSADDLAIELRGISKRFGAVKANQNINLKVPRGTIHGIVGENGAGKSTLMSILYGFYQADSGDILINGRKVAIHNSRDAIAAGIGMVHQHFMLVETFTVVENVMLGAEDHLLIRPSAKDARKELKRLADTYQLGVDLEQTMAELPVGAHQRTEILKALYRHADILILDEPTGVLTPQEADQLFNVLDSLRERGVTVILITHKLREIMDICDNVSVLRHGQMVAHRRTDATSMSELAELMVGRKLETRNFHRATPLPPSAEVGLAVRNLEVIDNRGSKRLKGVSFEVRHGEILGVAGVAGNGQSALLETLAGMRSPSAGEYEINDVTVTAETPTDPAMLRDHQVNHVPEDRLKLGLVRRFSASESSILGYQDHADFTHGGLLQLGTIRDHCQELMNGFDVRPPDPHLKSASFSGGNQQKLILAREIERAPEVLLVGQPTRGVDIGAIELIHERLVEMRDAGCAILLVSVELDEIMALSDRIIVMYEGRIVGEMAGADADKTTLGLMMANAWQGEGAVAAANGTDMDMHAEALRAGPGGASASLDYDLGSDSPSAGDNP